MDFNDIVGHERIIKNLKNSIKKDSISHSYLFQGSEAIGKKKVAMAFSKTLLCKKGGLEPCNECSSCIKFDSGNHPDFYLIEEDGNIIRKKQIEEAIKSMITKPLESKRKIYIIDNSFKMRVEAQNSFLKTLEEPPSYVNMILISTSTEKLLPTILSRCEIIKFNPIKKDGISTFLQGNYNKTVEEAEFISSFSKGSIGMAINLSTNEEFFHRREELIKIIDNIIKGDKLKVFASIDFFDENKDFINELLDIIIYWFRDLYIFKELGNNGLIINKDKLDLLSTQVSLSNDKINDIIKDVEKTRQNIERRVNYQLSIEGMLLKMQEV
ncbi:MAG TPA: DNA polymerase III subunit delta' [Tissierellia bacterium]|nr:DNA polymerase III subunit delta' [Tissierellia bacterium]